MNDIKAGRYRQHLGRGNGAVLRITSAGYQRTDAVANVPLGDISAHGLDDAGDLEARNIGGAVRRWVLALTLHDFGAIDARRGDFDQDILRPARRQRTLHRHQDVWRTRLANFDGNHACTMADCARSIRASTITIPLPRARTNTGFISMDAS